MALPKISHPKFETVLPSTGEKVTFRPFTGREQKVLLVAKESNDAKDTLKAVAQVVTDCSNIPNALQLPIFDLEWMFLMLRAKSVNNKISVRVKDAEDGQYYDATVDIDGATVTKSTVSNRVQITPTVGMKLKFPTVNNIVDGDMSDEWDVLASAVDSIWEGDEVTASSDMARPELKEWLSGLPLSVIEPIKAFFDGRPTVKIAVKYMKGEKEVSRELSGLQDFFESA